MTNIKIQIHQRNLGVRKQAVNTWKISREDKKDLLQFLHDMDLGKVNLGRKISEVRQLKYLDILKTPLEFFDKPTSKLTVKDMENFEQALSSDRIQSFKKAPFAQSTKVDIRKLLKIYLKWKFGDTEKFRKLCGWFDTRQVARTPDYLKESEIEALYKHCKSPAERYMIAMLFDSGTRAEEFHNIRYEDIQLPEGRDNFVRVTLKEEYSKTKGRVICLYWKHSLDAVRDYVKVRQAEGMTSRDPLFTQHYENARKILNRLGERALKKSLHYHLFRHSSATYYASRMNRQQLCYRYGWKFSSDMPDVYISRAGMENKDLDDKFAGTEIESLMTRLARREQDVDLLKERTARLEKEKATQQDFNLAIMQAFKNPEVVKTVAAELAQRGNHTAFIQDKRGK